MSRLLCPDCEDEFGKPLLDDDLSCPLCNGHYEWIKEKKQ